jgi:prepilin-type N-terminal cleavage/methylation domain-containing protein
MPLTPSGPVMRADRLGVTLVELVVALTLFGVVATLTLSVLRSQQRFHVGALQIIDTKRSVHQAVDLLYGDLRAASGADIYALSDSSIAFRAPLGASAVCALDSTRTLATLPTARGSGISTFLSMPRAADSLLVFDPGDLATAEDDRWRPHVLTANPSGGLCPLRPFGLAAHAADVGRGIGLAIAPPLTASVLVGSPVRFFRPTGYALYRSSGGEWMLGYSTCAAGTCRVRQPLSGPYLPFASGGAGGVALRYFDAQGIPTNDRSRVARVDVVARARSASVLDLSYLRGQRYQDSLAVTIALRNRL